MRRRKCTSDGQRRLVAHVIHRPLGDDVAVAVGGNITVGKRHAAQKAVGRPYNRPKARCRRCRGGWSARSATCRPYPHATPSRLMSAAGTIVGLQRQPPAVLHITGIKQISDSPFRRQVKVVDLCRGSIVKVGEGRQAHRLERPDAEVQPRGGRIAAERLHSAEVP